MKTGSLFALLGLSLSLTACAGDEATAGEETSAAAVPAEAPAAAAPAPAAATGEVVEVKMIMNGAENYFEPANVTVKQGDVVRFTLVSGVHNVSFPAAKNPGMNGLPAASPYLTTAGQTHDMVVDLAPGTYNFQCDPHVAMNMFGTLTVQ